jgi:BirA family transcriptional regulator, biotin operon repressor / biotin---[acetyl-CoA-carboxylase] ligase
MALKPAERAGAVASGTADPTAMSGPGAGLDDARAIAQAIAGVRAALSVPAAGMPLHVVARTHSTNSDLLDPAVHADTPRCVLWALTQQAGRGRSGRSWLSAAGGLSFSLRRPMQRTGSALLGLPLAVAVAACQGLEDLGVSGLAIKWPNDLLRRERKLGGILVEVSGSQAVIGIGLNVQLDAATVARLDQPAADLQPAIGSALPRELVLAALLNRLVPALDLFDASGFAAFRTDWSARAAWIGQPVRLGEDIEGTLLGVDASGALRVATAQGERRGLSGDLSLRRLDRSGADDRMAASDPAAAGAAPKPAPSAPVGTRAPRED